MLGQAKDREAPAGCWKTPNVLVNRQGGVTTSSQKHVFFISKVKQSPYNSVQQAEFYAILKVLRDFKEPLNIVTICRNI